MFAGACGGCHGADAPMTRDGAPSLALSSAVNAPTPQGVIQIILHGIPWREGKPAPYMPSFASALTDAQVADLAALSARDIQRKAGLERSSGRSGQGAGGIMIRLNVNGHDHEVDAEPDTPLLYVLRDELGLNGAKFGCGLGQCGACTVMVDGQAVFSCLTPVAVLPGGTFAPSRGSATTRCSAPSR